MSPTPRWETVPDYEDRLIERLTRRLVLVDSGCWEWLGHCGGSEHGRIRARGREQYVYRLVFEFVVGPIPDGLELDHLCRNPRCANPAHLEPVTRYENLRRAGGWTATHCSKGHAIADGNEYVRPDGSGSRGCRACRNEASRRHKVRTAAA